MRHVRTASAIAVLAVLATGAMAKAPKIYMYSGTTAAGGRISVTMSDTGLRSASILADLVCTAPNSTTTTTMTNNAISLGAAKFRSPGKIDRTFTKTYGPKAAPNATEVTRFVLTASGKRPRGGWKTLKGWFTSQYKSTSSTTVCRSGRIAFTLK